MPPSRWNPGDQVVLRQMWFGRVWAALPVTVVQDTPFRLSLYMAPGSEFVAPPCSREDYLAVVASGVWEAVDYTWNEQHHLWSSVPGEACDVWTIWKNGEWQHLGWKVNPQEPLRRTAIGFDTTDHVLDAMIDPTMDSWTWKDEGELAQAVALGLFSRRQADAIGALAQEVTNRMLTTDRDLMMEWASWRPEESWTTPALPALYAAEGLP